MVVPVIDPRDLPNVGRCETCKHWSRYPDEQQHAKAFPPIPGSGECGLVWMHDRKAWVQSGDGGIDTMPDFGCVEWEARR